MSNEGPGLTSTIWGISEPLGLTNPAAPGPLGAGTSDTAQFTRVAVGPSVPTLPGVDGDLASQRLLVGPSVAGAPAAITADANGLQFVPGGTHQRLLVTPAGSQLEPSIASTLLAPAAGAAGTIAFVNDATAPVIGSPLVGGGSVNALVWSNGTAYTVIGK